ncbi:ATP-binding protein [Dactylosporangium sp. NBC_01737]|uniref:ATP-binding protein n=1 Tax=Dactylosporangium sp. NBC_01737 TaxID=2975959 RepID=UPI003FA360B5
MRRGRAGARRGGRPSRGGAGRAVPGGAGGVTNARRHAGAGRVTVRATFDGATARLVVADDGRGFADGTADGFGLRGIRERVAAVGGSLDVTGRPGVVLTVTVPAA